MRQIVLLSTLLMGCLFWGCEKVIIGPDIHGDEPIVATDTFSGTISKNGNLVFSIGSVFVGGGTANPLEGSSHRCHFYQEKFETGPNWNEVEAIVEIYGFRHYGIEYNKPGQYIDQIRLNGLTIPMNQGKYEGGNELVKDVQIKSYKFASYIDNDGHQNKDADINIVITSTAGDIITIKFANDVTPYDGYY